ncbi:DUF3307 domain-containing protein [Bacillus sp. 03113]|uniref:DUF3307 domain-containing protein n=1 Tax=Bacillus sp. 03113 TaxID=2578211 RepID=UPI0011433389|nr:DUF3307 domain-containing protein [Bacillus sp. 03113]
MIILCLIIAHLIGDFYLQTDKMVKNKSKYLRRHLLHHFVLSMLVLTGFYLRNDLTYFFKQAALPSIAIVFFHYGIDRIKILLLHTYFKQPIRQFYLFILDQALHIGAVILVCIIFLDFDLTSYTNHFNVILSQEAGQNISTINTILFLILMFIISTTVSSHFIKLLVGILPDHLSLYEGKYVIKREQTEASHMASQPIPSISEEFTYLVNKKQHLSRGVYIGYLERLLVIVLIVNNAFTSIGFIVAAKSIVRFKQMDDRDFAEYFLLGTLSSIFLGVIYGVIIKIVLT